MRYIFYKITHYIALLSVILLPLTTWAITADEYFHAIAMDDIRSVQSFLDEGSDPNLINHERVPGLVLAARDGSIKVFRILVNLNNIKINATTPHDETALMMASLQGNEEMVRLLIEKGAEINKSGWSPLHYAAARGHILIIKLLLSKSANINAQSPNQTTPLMMAAMYGSYESVKVLLDAGADVMQRNALNLTALDFAQQANRTDAAILLNKALEAKHPRGSW